MDLLLTLASKLKTGSRLLLAGDLKAFSRLLLRNAKSAVSNVRSVRIGKVQFRMIATSDVEQTIFDDEREHRLLQLAPAQGLRCAYDIGANVGMHTLYYSCIADRVVAFEPSPANHARLMENIQLNGRENIEVRRIALFDRAGTLDFWDYGINQSSTLLDRDHTRDFDKISVESCRLDDLELPPPDFVKIDVEGAELHVLRGAVECLRKHKPFLHLEVHPSMGVSEAEVRGVLEALGYSIKIIAKGDEKHYICEVPRG